MGPSRHRLYSNLGYSLPDRPRGAKRKAPHPMGAALCKPQKSTDHDGRPKLKPPHYRSDAMRMTGSITLATGIEGLVTETMFVTRVA